MMRRNTDPLPPVNNERGPNGRRICRCGCGQEIEKGQHSWAKGHWKKVAIIYDWATQRAFVKKRAKGKCEHCGCDPVKLRKEHRERVEKTAYNSEGRKLLKEWREEQGFPDTSRKWYEIDHILPIALGGAKRVENLQFLCVPCHKKKTKVDNRRIRKWQKTT